MPARDCLVMVKDNYRAKKIYLNESKRILKLNWDITHNITSNHRQYQNGNIVTTGLSTKPKTENTATVQQNRTDSLNSQIKSKIVKVTTEWQYISTKLTDTKVCKTMIWQNHKPDQLTFWLFGQMTAWLTGWAND